MIGGRQCGPYSLEELARAGIRPDTYVWCKEMSDWQRADEVADICRYFRQHLVAVQNPSTPAIPVPADNSAQDQGDGPDYSAVPPSFRRALMKGGIEPPEMGPDPANHDPATPPPSGMLAVAIMATLFCFPITGAVAIYFALRARKEWNEACRADSKSSAPLYSTEERDRIRQDMADSVRSCKMWTGITIFLGIMFYAACIHLL